MGDGADAALNQLPPPSSPIIRNHRPKELQQSAFIEVLPFSDLNTAGRGIAVALINDALRIGCDGIIDEDVEMVFGSHERANVAVLTYNSSASIIALKSFTASAVYGLLKSILRTA